MVAKIVAGAESAVTFAGDDGNPEVRVGLEVICLLYTFRAHETVLDLVCRFLLEKKKKQKAYTTTQTCITIS